jgi:hypothetical protein
MPDSQRLEFVTRHFKDLQSIRLAPVPALMLLAPLLAPQDVPHMSKVAAWGILLILLFCVVGFFWWSTVAIKRRYGSVKVSGEEALRMGRNPIILALRLLPLVGVIFAPRTSFWDWFIACTILISLLTTILDSTNLAIRRVVWTIGLVVLFAAGPFLIGVDRGAATLSLGGAVWLSISTFDFQLLRRTFAELSASPPPGATEPVAQLG